MKQLFLFLIILMTYQTATCQCKQGEVRWRYWKDVQSIDYDFVEMYKLERFPNGPDYVRVLNSLATPDNYNNDYAAQVRGFIRTNTTGQVVFNVTGDDITSFSLSTDDTPANLILIGADTNDIAALDTLTLQANQYYYFELIHREFGGRDFARVEWKAGFLAGSIGANLWSLVGGDFIYDSCDTLLCPLRGTVCDDGNALTINDQEDGNCHCLGNPITSNTCVGERGIVDAYVYEGLSGNDLDPLNTAITNGTNPDTVERLGEVFFDFNLTQQGHPSEYGTYIQAFLTVPVTGIYDFNITGTRENVFYISSNEDPANKTANEMGTDWWTGWYDHTTFENQSIEGLLLNANQYYYVELRHKGDGNWQYFNLYWKTPYQTRDDWVRVPTFYFFDYTCETTCLAAGVGCNDADPYTANDQWDGNCNCAGTPCSGPADCDDPSTAYEPFAECETTNLLDNRADDAWLSCSPLSDSPNLARNGQHWIQYDFGQLYNLSTSHFWNYNADGATAAGFQQVVIDYSTDGINWTELGTYTWLQASGAGNYEGFDGPDFSNITAQYVLISSLDDPNSCRGLSKVAFNAVSCPVIKLISPRIDQTFLAASNLLVEVEVTEEEAAITSVALYLNDVLIGTDNAVPYAWSGNAALQNLTGGAYKLSTIATDANGTNCEMSTLIHVITAEEAECQTTDLVLDTMDFPVYRTNQTIVSSSIIPNPDKIEYIAAQSITLTAGFHAEQGSDFLARIEDCTAAANIASQERSRIITPISTTISGGQSSVRLYPNPVQSTFTLEINAWQSGLLSISIYDMLGKEIRNLVPTESIDKGIQQISISASHLTAGLYYCRVRIGREEFTKSFVRVVKN